MVLLDTQSKPHASWTICAEIWGLDGREQVIKNNSTVVINSDHIRQSAKIILDKGFIETMHRTKSEYAHLKHSIDEFHRSNPTSEDEEVKANFGHHVSSSSSKSDSGGNTNFVSSGLHHRVTS
jgi:hypothetical protein